MGTILLIDGNSLINRAFYGVKGSSTLSTSDGTPTNAVFGFYNMIQKHVTDIKPDQIAVAFDTKAPTFRHQLYDNYKGDRKGMPDELAVQLPLLKELLKAMQIHCVEQEGLEADDFIGILSCMGEEAGESVVIITGDRDALQLVSQLTTVMIPSTGKGGTEINSYNPKAVFEKYGVEPAALIDVKGLMGDPSDQIPGVPQVGEKTALSLIIQYGSIEGVYENIDEIKKPNLNKNLREFKDQAYLSRTLGTIVRENRNVLEEGFLTLNHLKWNGVDEKELYRVFRKLEFRSLIKKLKLNEKYNEEDNDTDNSSGSVQSDTMNGATQDIDDLKQSELSHTISNDHKSVFDEHDIESKKKVHQLDTTTQEFSIDSFDETMSQWKKGLFQPISIKSIEDVDHMVLQITDSLHECACVFVDLSGTASGEAFELSPEEDTEPVLFQAPIETDSKTKRTVFLMVYNEHQLWHLAPSDEITEGMLAKGLSEAFQGKQIYCHDMKALAGFFVLNRVQPPVNLFDTMLAEYLIDAARDKYWLRNLVSKYLSVEGDTPDQLLSEARKKAVPEENLVKAAILSALSLIRIGHLQQQLLEDNDQNALYKTVEMPLAIVLGEMEREGFLVDPTILRIYGNELAVKIHDLELKIHELAGESFNINSPKQLGVILFEKLKLPATKKNKTGYSTDVEVLESLSLDNPIALLILEYRQLSKLKSTYADGLLKVISPITGRVHSCFNQTIAVTGRISSTEPNLQNIPIRTEAGRLIRKAFLAKEGYTFVDADYSQIELRILAHITGDETLKKAFLEGIDIHQLTASQVFHVPLADVTKEMRRRAKAVNFGIIYGISDYGLAQDLGIYRKEASEYIEGYLNTYPGVREYMTNVVEEAKQMGYVETLLHRRRYLPELKSSNFNIRSFGKRIALNTPIQGTAADIIKIAMIRVRDALLVGCPDAKLILQVHDELVVETPIDKVSLVENIVKKCMEGAMTLSVPLIADVGHGPNWYVAK